MPLMWHHCKEKCPSPAHQQLISAHFLPHQRHPADVILLIHTDFNFESERKRTISLQWRHNERDGVSNHQPHDCLLIRLFRRRSKKTPKLRVTDRWRVNFPHKGPVTRRMFSFDDVIMINKFISEKSAMLIDPSFSLFGFFFFLYFYSSLSFTTKNSSKIHNIGLMSRKHRQTTTHYLNLTHAKAYRRHRPRIKLSKSLPCKSYRQRFMA